MLWSTEDCHKNRHGSSPMPGDPQHRDSYSVYMHKWLRFCPPHIDPFHPPESVIIEFLTSLSNSGCGHSTLMTAKSAISAFVMISDSPYSMANHPLICQLTRGVSNLKPSRPRYTCTWPVSKVLDFWKSQGPNDQLSLLSLSQKTVMLLLLVTAGRGQDIFLMQLQNLEVVGSGVNCVLSLPTKTSKGSQPSRCFRFEAYLRTL